MDMEQMQDYDSLADAIGEMLEAEPTVESGDVNIGATQADVDEAIAVANSEEPSDVSTVHEVWAMIGSHMGDGFITDLEAIVHESLAHWLAGTSLAEDDELLNIWQNSDDWCTEILQKFAAYLNAECSELGDTIAREIRYGYRPQLPESGWSPNEG